jgi:hypothetical protein
MERKIVVQGMKCLKLLGFFIMISCGHNRFGEVIPPKKFVNVLVDVHIADGIAIENMGHINGLRLDSATLYNSVFNKYGVTRAMFDSTMAYYTEHPDDFQKIYNKVTARLKRMEDEINGREIKESTKKREIIDTILKK